MKMVSYFSKNTSIKFEDLFLSELLMGENDFTAIKSIKTFKEYF